MLKVLALSDPSLPGRRNMAVDLCLMNMAERGEIDLALRTYTWEPHAVSLGRLQKDFGGLDPDRLFRDGIHLVRRPTGGRAVWHGRELTYSVIAGAGHRLFSQGVEASLMEVAGFLQQALEMLGVPVRGNRSRNTGEGYGRGPCFLSHGRHEIMTPDGRKLVGSAQARTRAAFLEHGSILFHNDQLKMPAYFAAPEKARASVMRRFLKERTGTVCEYVPEASPEDLAPLLHRAFAARFRVTPEPLEHTGLPENALGILARECDP